MEAIVSLGVSRSSVFTIRVHPTIIHGCKQTNANEKVLVNESAIYAVAKVLADGLGISLSDLFQGI